VASGFFFLLGLLYILLRSSQWAWQIILGIYNQGMEKERGRPPKPPAEKRGILFPIRVNETELETIRRAGGEKPSTWAREVLLRAAARRKT
jgi:hypothetical protein